MPPKSCFQTTCLFPLFSSASVFDITEDRDPMSPDPRVTALSPFFLRKLHPGWLEDGVPPRSSPDQNPGFHTCGGFGAGVSPGLLPVEEPDRWSCALDPEVSAGRPHWSRVTGECRELAKFLLPEQEKEESHQEPLW